MGPWGHQRTSQEGEKVPSSLFRPRARPQNRSIAFLQWILIGASESPVNLKGFEPSIDLDFRFCMFAIFVLPLHYFLGGSSGSCWPSTAAERRVTIHCKYGAIGALASYDFSTCPIFEFRKSALLLFWGPGDTRGPPRKGKKCRLRSFDPALVRKTDRHHYYNGLWRPAPSHPLKMQRFEPSHGTL